MIETKLILFEGVPGSGKSTLAQTILRRLGRQGIPARWWYEEDANHPVYIFQDQQSLRRRLDQLSGQYREVLVDALEQWRRFVETALAADGIILIDGCLFGYLTWSLFPLGVPEPDIHAYLVAVEQIVAPLNPCLIYLYQEDIARSLRRVLASRGSAMERRYTRNVEKSPYGKQRGLRGFEGLVRYWMDYRAFLDTALAVIPWPTLALESGGGEWRAYEQRALAFLNLPSVNDDGPGVNTDLGRFVGTYRSSLDSSAVTCTVLLADGSLLLDGMPETWPRSRLLPREPGVFDIASFPIEIRFSENASGTVDAMSATGPAFLGGSIPNAFEKVHPGGHLSVTQ